MLDKVTQVYVKKGWSQSHLLWNKHNFIPTSRLYLGVQPGVTQLIEGTKEQEDRRTEEGPGPESQSFYLWAPDRW